MKIRRRLSLIFTLTTACVLFTLSLVIYLMTARFHQVEFNRRLSDRVELTEKFFLEELRMPPQVAAQVRDDFLKKLVEEEEWILDPDVAMPPELENVIGQKVASLKVGANLTFSLDRRRGMARIYDLDGHRHLIVVVALDHFGLRKLANLRRILLIAFPLGLLLAAGIGFWATKRALAPLEGHIEQAKKMGASNLGARLMLPRHKDEIHDFVSIINELLERLEQTFIFQHNFIRSASHEIRNPLTAISGEAEVALLAERTPESYQQSLHIIALEADRLNELVNNLLSIARIDPEQNTLINEPVRIGQLMAELREFAEYNWPSRAIEWPVLSAQEQNTLLNCNFPLLRSALSNIIDNACKYGGEDPVSIHASFQQGQFLFVVRDQGIGIPAGEMPLILQPLYRCTNARAFRGQGIGLPLVDRIIKLHKGHLDIHSEDGEGTTVHVSLACQV
jgi:signal transduction histidine kinase